jgi:hypothetical protein
VRDGGEIVKPPSRWRESVAKMKSGQPNRLDSQFAAFEPPGSEENPITVATDRPLGEIVQSIIRVLYLEAPRPR